jgi:polyphosphate kinase
MTKNKSIFRNREISWLDFNYRVLQEAVDNTTPLIERLRFLGIFSNNLDEFFRVRVATLTEIIKKKVKASEEFSGYSPKKIMEEINITVKDHNEIFSATYQAVTKMLSEEGLNIIDGSSLTNDQENYIRAFFREKVRMNLFPVMLRKGHLFADLKDKSIYLAVLLKKEKKSKKSSIALIEIPSDTIGRFIILPGTALKTDIVFLDDVIRTCLDEIFTVIGYSHFEAYTIKFTRNAELDLDTDISKSFLEIMSEGVKQRKCGNPVRFIYDNEMPGEMLKDVIKSFGIKKQDMLIPGGKYHNFKDFISFPVVGHEKLRFQAFKPVLLPVFSPKKSVFDVIASQDILLHYPYNPFQYVVDMLREASIDPDVTSIKMTIYRAARNSNVINALINAARNGKKVTVFIEIQARFDEEANIQWARVMQESGINIIQTLPSLKVHCKLLLIKRKEKNGLNIYGAASTGNFNESTARQYCDETLLTCDRRITSEMDRVFDMFYNLYKGKNFRHLLVAPNFLRNKICKMITNEIKNVQNGQNAEIIFKLNSLTDPEIAERLIDAAKAGVKVILIIRGACILSPDDKKLNGMITAISVVDRFLEHSRIYIFKNGGNEKYYISSADMMTRNLDRRIEVAVPIYDKGLQKRLKDLINIQLDDNVKSRLLSSGKINEFRKTGQKKKTRSQEAIYEYLKNLKD